MAIKKISEFVNTTTINDDDLLLIEQGGGGKNVNISDVVDAVKMHNWVVIDPQSTVLSLGSALYGVFDIFSLLTNSNREQMEPYPAFYILKRQESNNYGVPLYSKDCITWSTFGGGNSNILNPYLIFVDTCILLCSSNSPYTRTYFTNSGNWYNVSNGKPGIRCVISIYNSTVYQLAVGDDGVILYHDGEFVGGSSDTWASTTNSYTVDFTSAVQGHNLTIIVGSGGIGKYSSDVSTDTWTDLDMKCGTNTIKSIAYNGSTTNPKYVAVGQQCASYSEDGINWTSIYGTENGINTSMISICYGNGKFVCISENRKVAYSSDGVNWITIDLPASKYAVTSDALKKIVAGDDKYVILTQDDTLMYCSY